MKQLLIHHCNSMWIYTLLFQRLILIATKRRNRDVKIKQALQTGIAQCKPVAIDFQIIKIYNQKSPRISYGHYVCLLMTCQQQKMVFTKSSDNSKWQQQSVSTNNKSFQATKKVISNKTIFAHRTVSYLVFMWRRPLLRSPHTDSNYFASLHRARPKYNNNTCILYVYVKYNNNQQSAL